MKHLSAAILIFIFLTFTTVIITGCAKESDVKSTNKIEESNNAEFIVEIDYEFHANVGDWYICDIVMPKVADSVANGNIINEQLKSSYVPNSIAGWEKDLKDAPLLAEYDETGVFNRNYCVSNMDGICSLNVVDTYTGTTHTILEGNEFIHQERGHVWTRQFVNSFYYDENTGNVITREKFLHEIGYVDEDILKAFKDKYGSQYDKYEYGVNDIIFWFNWNNELQVSDSFVKTLTPPEEESGR